MPKLPKQNCLTCHFNTATNTNLINTPLFDLMVMYCTNNKMQPQLPRGIIKNLNPECQNYQIKRG